MNLSEPFIRRPVATTLLTAALVLGGAVGYVMLPVAPLPQVDFPTISVSASLPGASAQIMASSVATPLERQLGQIAEVTEMTSSSSLGTASITLQFALSRDIEGAAHDVQAAINTARSYLPVNLPQNPSYRKVNPADAPIMILALTSNKYPVAELYDLASTMLEQKLSQVQGVGQVVVGGGASPAVRIEANPRQLAAYGLSLASISALVGGENAHEPRGQIANGLVTADLITNDQITAAADYAPLVVGQHAGRAVRLADVAEVVDSTQNLRTAGYMDGARAITLIVFRQPGANILQTVAAIRAQLGFLQAVLPSGITTTVVLDSTTMIRASVTDVERSLMLSVLLVVLVTFLFLRNLRATLIPVIAVPCSLIGTLAVIYLLGYSLDNLSLMALTISTGFVLDDAIVVMDNVSRYLEAGMSPLAAAIQGAGEVGFTVLTISISLIAVFLPILLMGGIVGRLFREFAVTVSTAIVVSMLISLTATPAMCAALLQPETGRHGRLYHTTERGFLAMLGLYERTLAWVLDRPAPALLSLAAVVGLNAWLLIAIPKGFFPEQDTGALMGSVRGPQDASFPYMNDSLQQLVAVVKADPAVDHVNATIGSGSTNSGSMYVALKPLAVRRINADAVIARLRPQLNALPVASATLQAVQEIRIGGRSSNALYQYTLQSESLSDLSLWAPRLVAAMKKLSGFLDVSSDQQDGGLAETLQYDRTAAARLGQTAQSLDQALYGAFGQAEISVVYTPANQYYVVLEAAPAFWQSPAGLGDVFLNPGSGASEAGPNTVAPLLSVATATAGTTPLQINHTAGFPSTTVSFNLAENISLSQASSAVQGAERKIGMPTDIQGAVSGTLEAYKQSLASEPWLIATALLAVYIVLGILYESLVHPLTIISSLPSASVGAVLALLLFHVDLSVIAIIGIVLLIGIVKKNAIMMIDFALAAERAGGKTPRQAIEQACGLRFRPILMTTMAALFGALPLAFGTGMGAELRQPLGITIVGGLLLSQLLTLFTTPVVYLELDRLRQRALARREGRQAPAAYARAQGSRVGVA